MRTLLFLFVLATSQLYSQNLKMVIPAANFQPKLAFSNYNGIHFTHPNFNFKTHTKPYLLNVYKVCGYKGTRPWSRSQRHLHSNPSGCWYVLGPPTAQKQTFWCFWKQSPVPGQREHLHKPNTLF